MSVIVVFY